MWKILSICAGGLFSSLFKVGKKSGKTMKAWTMEHDKDGIPTFKGIWKRSDAPEWAKGDYDNTFGKRSK